MHETTNIKQKPPLSFFFFLRRRRKRRRRRRGKEREKIQMSNSFLFLKRYNMCVESEIKICV